MEDFVPLYDSDNERSLINCAQLKRSWNDGFTWNWLELSGKSMLQKRLLNKTKHWYALLLLRFNFCNYYFRDEEAGGSYPLTSTNHWTTKSINKLISLVICWINLYCYLPCIESLIDLVSIWSLIKCPNSHYSKSGSYRIFGLYVFELADIKIYLRNFIHSGILS